MRAGVVVREAWGLLTGRPVLSMMLALSALLCTCIPAVLELFAVRALALAYVADLDSGAHILVVSDEAAGTLAGGECEGLRTWSGVTRVSWLTTGGDVSFAESPRNPFRIVHVGGGFAKIVDPSFIADPTGALLLGAAAAAELGVRPGAELSFRDRAVRIDGVVAEEVRAADQARWVYIVESTPAAVEQCWVETEPRSLERVYSAIRSGFTPSPSLEVEALALPLADDALEAWTQRPQQYAWVLCGVLGALPFMILLQTRRHEFAVYLLAGFPRGDTASIFATNVMFLAVFSGSTAAALSLFCSLLVMPAWTATAAVMMLASTSGVTAILVAVVTLFTFVLSVRNASAAIKERG